MLFSCRTLPALSALFTLCPILFSLGISFFDWNLFSSPVFVDTAHYQTLVSSASSHFWDYFGNSLFFLLVVPVQMAIALMTAYLLNENLKGSLLFKIIFFMPVVVSVISTVIMWEYVLDTENGLPNGIIATLGGSKIPWLYDSSWIKTGISLMVVWQGSAFGTIIYYAALQGIPDQLYEVATIDGASRWQQFLNITVLSIARPYTLLPRNHRRHRRASTLRTHLRSDTICSGGAHNLIIEIYQKAYHEFQMGYASALSWILFIIIFLIWGLYWKSSGSDQHMLEATTL